MVLSVGPIAAVVETKIPTNTVVEDLSIGY